MILRRIMEKQRQNESYIELKKDLKDKYCEIIKSDLDEIRNYVLGRATKLFGPDFLDKIEKVENLRSERKKSEKEFFKSEEYKTAQKELKTAKNEAKNSTPETEEDANRRLNKAISTITTLNVTIKNRLKPYDEKISALDDEISFVTEKNDDKIREISQEIISRVKSSVAERFKAYFEELNELSDEFGVEEEKDDDLPFDQNVIRLEIPIFSEKIAENLEGEDSEDEEGNFVKSTDNNGILN